MLMNLRDALPLRQAERVQAFGGALSNLPTGIVGRNIVSSLSGAPASKELQAIIGKETLTSSAWLRKDQITLRIKGHPMWRGQKTCLGRTDLYRVGRAVIGCKLFSIDDRQIIVESLLNVSPQEGRLPLRGPLLTNKE